MARWYSAKFLELSGIALCTSALFWGLIQRNMQMEVRLLSIGALVFGAGWLIDSGGKGGQ